MNAMTPSYLGAGSAFGCPLCRGDTGVKDSRPNAERTAIRRRRLCDDCGFRFSTFEMQIPEGFSPQGLRDIITATKKSLDVVNVAITDAREQLANIEKVQQLMYGAKQP